MTWNDLIAAATEDLRYHLGRRHEYPWSVRGLWRTQHYFGARLAVARIREYRTRAAERVQSDASLHETLAAQGLEAQPSSVHQCKQIARLVDNAVVFEGRAGDVWDWLREGSLPALKVAS